MKGKEWCIALDNVSSYIDSVLGLRYKFLKGERATKEKVFSMIPSMTEEEYARYFRPATEEEINGEFELDGEQYVLEKAKRYDEALERARQINDEHRAQCADVMVKVFPELAESEDDRIRKAILELVRQSSEILEKKNQEQMIAWLEKQGKNNMGISEATKQKLEDNLNEALEKETPESCNEFLDEQCEQKPADKVEPKFKIGDWVVAISSGNLFKILSVHNGLYKVLCEDGIETNYPFKEVDKDLRLWTIQDAKDGDVLNSLDSNRPFIYKERNGYEQATAYCGLNIYGKFFVWGTKDCIITLSNYVPATKEQRGALMKKMADAGWEFDFDKKELKKIEQKSAEWHREDEQNLNACLGFIPDAYLCRWLKDVIHVKYDKPAWSEEDEAIYYGVIETEQYMLDVVNGIKKFAVGNISIKEECTRELNWLESLKDRIQPKPKQEWSEEDRLHYMNVLEALEYVKGCKSDYDKIETIKSDIAWFKFFKDRYTWKPSDEQIEALDFAADCIVLAEFCVKRKVLKELLEQLKKLMEE